MRMAHYTMHSVKAAYHQRTKQIVHERAAFSGKYSLFIKKKTKKSK